MPYVAQVAVGRLEKLAVYGNDYSTPDGTGNIICNPHTPRPSLWLSLAPLLICIQPRVKRKKKLTNFNIKNVPFNFLRCPGLHPHHGLG
jgi:hypothetical protein